MKCKLSRGHSVHDMVYYAIWNCTSINLVNNEQTPSAKNLWCQTCLHLKGSRCKNHILKCITIPGSDYKNATTHFIHFSSLVTYYFSNNKKGDASHEWYFVTKIVLTYCEKNFPSDREKLLKFEAEGREFTNSERSEQFLVTECVFNLFLEVSHI